MARGKPAITREEFVNRMDTIFDCMYTYELSTYSSRHHPITLTCKLHGPFTVKHAYEREQQTMSEYSQYTYVPNKKFMGWTEAFTTDIIEYINVE